MMNIEIPGRALVSLEGLVDAEIVRAVLPDRCQACFSAVPALDYC